MHIHINKTAFRRTLLSLQSILILVSACIITALFVWSGFDWWYFIATYTTATRPLLFIADVLGFIIPVVVPIVLYVYGSLKKNLHARYAAIVILLSASCGFLCSMLIKAFTGRISPPHHGPFDVDISAAFQFGLMEHHIIGGWPSSHATVMFAIAACCAALFPRRVVLVCMLYMLACFVGIGVTFGFHWVSEFVAGACLGYVIGKAVAASARYEHM
jgi:membrane-associated phospholipid phosphatase